MIIKIALFLNFLSRDNYTKLIKEIQKYPDSHDVDVLKIMAANNYLAPGDLPHLKKACLSFARAQEDTRFGALAVDFNFITQSNLELALEEQKRLFSTGTIIRIGSLLVEAGMLSQRERNLILQKQKIENAGQKSLIRENRSDSRGAALPDTKGEFNPAQMMEIRESHIIFYIQNDALNAYMKKEDDFNPGMQLADLKSLLEKIGIIYGVADDDALTGFINQSGYRDTVFRVAGGIAPTDGRDAYIVYMFKRDYLKAGSLSEDGTMDFKNRGEIPFVARGDILAEKIPVKTGKEGINVYGDIIPAAEPVDISFTLGKGVQLSKDEFQVIAAVDGNPKTGSDGEISVNSAYFIEGDVDYTTGHVKFDKNVYITGTIKSGFRVEAIDVVANTVDGGIVKAEGDVFVQNGVTESVIQAKGNIKAGFIHRSKAMCMGDMSVFKEIVDTDILIDGTFDMTKGKMYSSHVCARGGAKVYAIGSEKATPSVLTVGTTLYLETILADIDQIIERSQNLLEVNTFEKERIESEITALNEKLKNARRARQQTLMMIKEARENEGIGREDSFQKSLGDAEEKIDDLKNRKTLLEIRLKETGRDISIHSETVKNRVKDKFTLKRLNRKNPAKPIVDISGKAYSDTRICGRHAHIFLRQDISHARIMEMDSRRDGNAKPNWEMIISNL